MSALPHRLAVPIPTQLGYCNTRIASRKQPDGFRRGRVPVRTLPTVAAGTAERTIRYLRFNHKGNVVREAVCLLPDISGVEQLALAQFGEAGAVMLHNCEGQDGGGGGVQVQNCEQRDGGGGGVSVQGDACCSEVWGLCVRVCPTGKSWSEDGTRCICDNGSELDNCGNGDEGEDEEEEEDWDEDDPWEEEPCDPAFEECDEEEDGGDGGGDGPPPGDSVTVTLSCGNGSVSWMGSANCTLTATPAGAAYTVEGWSFTSADGGVHVEGPSSGNTWSGSMVTSGAIKVAVNVNGSTIEQVANITVNRRSGWSWAGSVINGGRASPGQYDSCLDSDAAGLTFGADCSSGSGRTFFFSPRDASSGYTVSAVLEGGPNGGVWYVNSVTTSMLVRSQVNRLFRPDGIVYSVTNPPIVVTACRSYFNVPEPFALPNANLYVINNGCMQSSVVDNLIAYIWNHEDLHRFKDVQVANEPHNDVHLHLEPLVAMQENELHSYAESLINIVHDRVSKAVCTTHTGSNLPPYNLWMHSGGGAWVYSLVELDESKGPGTQCLT